MLAALRRSWACVAAPIISVVLWCAYYHRWPGTPEFGLPTAYLDAGDALLMLGIAKGFASFPVPWNLQIPQLNAPVGADWNDYPHTEKLIYYAWGLLLHVFSPGVAANIMLLLAHVGTALAFAWVGRRLGYRNSTALVGALVLAFSTFMIDRGLAHLNVIFIWHVPLLLFLVARLANITALPERRVRFAAYAVMFACGVQNPYYPPIFLQLVFLATARAWLLRRNQVARFGATALAWGAGTFVFGQLNVFIRAHRAGPNLAFAGRSLEEMRMWALRLPDMFLPLWHPIHGWEAFARAHYFDAGNPPNENAFAFLGVVGCSLFIGLTIWAVATGLRGQAQRITWEAWVILYILLFALSGGIDYLLGGLGMTWLRAVNRYSIVILCCLLLWGCRVVDAMTRESRRAGLLVGAAAFTTLELFGSRPDELVQRLQTIRANVDSDRAFAQALERRLPVNAAVFELPVMLFPEDSPRFQMGEYEPFRPYLWGHYLRYSFGTHKGRPREAWQRTIEALPAPRLCEELSRRGFKAVIVNRRGFADRAAALEASFSAAQNAPFATSQDGDWVAYGLNRCAADVGRKGG